MKERGIIMSGDNPNLILSDRKTQTRRIIKKQPITGDVHETFDAGVFASQTERSVVSYFSCPYGVAGDRLWMRENFHIARWWRKKSVIADRAELLGWYGDQSEFHITLTAKESALYIAWKRKTGNFPSIFMFRSLSRALMDLTKVRAERVQDISEEDAKAEGMKPFGVGHPMNPLEPVSYIPRYRQLWDSLHGKGAWALNPWVWALDTPRIK